MKILLVVLAFLLSNCAFLNESYKNSVRRHCTTYIVDNRVITTGYNSAHTWTKQEYIDFLNRMLKEGKIGEGIYEQEMICIGEK